MEQREPEAGEVYRKNGRDFIVHFVECGEVYGVQKPANMRLEDAIEAGKAHALRADICRLEGAELL